jgi:hypothetical protein
MALTFLGLFWATSLACAVPESGATLPVSADSLERLYGRGKPFAEFLAQVRSRKETWTGNYERAVVPPELLERARAVGGAGRWRFLVVAEDWCGDSANTIPYLARLVDSVSTLELRVIGVADGKGVMEAHRTPDGRAATPTVVLLDANGQDAGCFIERPAALRAWFAANRDKLSEGELSAGRDEWRRNDAGRETLREMVELLEAAARGERICDGRSP